MGGYDLYGNYYYKTQDALNAELAQMCEIDSNITKRKLKQQQSEIRHLHQKIMELENGLKVHTKKRNKILEENS